jgi:glycosyltransferase involved in cell wall biosynthesis
MKKTAVEGKVPPRVIYLTDLTPTGKFGSLEEQTLNLAKEFAKRGSLFLPVFGGPPAQSVIGQYSAEHLPVEGLNLHQVNAATFFRLLGLIRRNRIAVVHWNFYSPSTPYVLLLTLFAPTVTHVITDHTSRVLPLEEPSRGVKRFLKRIFFRRYKKVFCISDFVQDCLKLDGTWSNLVRCTHFINTERFKPNPVTRAEMRAQFGADQRFVVLFVGQLIRWKGVDVALRALAELPQPIDFWIVGDGEERHRLENLSNELSLGSRVRFWGSQNNVEPYMQSADCLVCPSLWGEATGLVNLEALACGLPVVASAIGGIPEFVENNETGLLFVPGDHVMLSEQIRRLYMDTDLYQRLSKAARREAAAQFSIERRLPEYVTAY